MQQLIEGVHRFQKDEFGRYRALFKRLSQQGQNPHTLFITCSDSRVLAELITQSQPGDLFVVKNLGNFVPPFSVEGSTNSTAAAIEFAVQVLEVKDIVVCGHSQCGAIGALVRGLPGLETMPHLAQWLDLAKPVRRVVEEGYNHLVSSDDKVRAAEEENVLFALENLYTYPVVQQRLAKGTLHIHGWFFNIANAQLFAYDPEHRQFMPLGEETPQEPAK